MSPEWVSACPGRDIDQEKFGVESLNPERRDSNKRETVCNSKVAMLKLCNGTRFHASISSENF